jgi:hypothetical protein
MTANHQKFLVELVETLTRKEVFFLVWFFIVGGFSLLMISYYRKSNRRNFRPSEETATSRVFFDPRRVPSPEKDKKPAVSRPTVPRK